MIAINWHRQLLVEVILYFANYFVAFIPIHLLRKMFYRNVMGFKIGKNSYIFMGAAFDTRRNFLMGDNSVINQNCRIDNRGTLFIANNVSISSDVQIITAYHDPQSSKFEGRTKLVNICDYVFIGTRAMILPGVTLGKGCVVAAGAIVTKDVAENVIVAGVPARSIGIRNEKHDYIVNYGRLLH